MADREAFSPSRPRPFVSTSRLGVRFVVKRKGSFATVSLYSPHPDPAVVVMPEEENRPCNLFNHLQLTLLKELK
jgi:hypothetical protein